MHFSCAARTDTGIVRSGNEDNYLMLADRGVFIVADGMGGHAAGEVASEMAVRIIAKELGTLRGLSDAEAGDRIRHSIVNANQTIYERTLTEHDKRGMGTTTTALILMPRRYLIGQVGDSRAYLLRDGEFFQVTKDHSYVQEQVDLGLLTAEQARVHPYSNVITRCIGANSDVVPDVYFGSLRTGDVLLLASDGLTGMLEDEQLSDDPPFGGGAPGDGGPDDQRGQPPGRSGQHHGDRRSGSTRPSPRPATTPPYPGRRTNPFLKLPPWRAAAGHACGSRPSPQSPSASRPSGRTRAGRSSPRSASSSERRRWSPCGRWATAWNGWAATKSPGSPHMTSRES